MAPFVKAAAGARSPRRRPTAGQAVQSSRAAFIDAVNEMTGANQADGEDEEAVYSDDEEHDEYDESEEEDDDDDDDDDDEDKNDDNDDVPLATLRKNARSLFAAEKEEKKKRKSYEKRKLTRWNPGKDQLLLLSIQYECEKAGISLLWDAAVKHVNPGAGEGAALQHLTKLRKVRVAAGLPVPPIPPVKKRSGREKTLPRDVILSRDFNLIYIWEDLTPMDWHTYKLLKYPGHRPNQGKRGDIGRKLVNPPWMNLTMEDLPKPPPADGVKKNKGGRPRKAAKPESDSSERPIKKEQGDQQEAPSSNAAIAVPRSIAPAFVAPAPNAPASGIVSIADQVMHHNADANRAINNNLTTGDVLGAPQTHSVFHPATPGHSQARQYVSPYAPLTHPGMPAYTTPSGQFANMTFVGGDTVPNTPINGSQPGGVHLQSAPAQLGFHSIQGMPQGPPQYIPTQLDFHNAQGMLQEPPQYVNPLDTQYSTSMPGGFQENFHGMYAPNDLYGGYPGTFPQDNFGSMTGMGNQNIALDPNGMYFAPGTVMPGHFQPHFDLSQQNGSQDGIHGDFKVGNVPDPLDALSSRPVSPMTSAMVHEHVVSDLQDDTMIDPGLDFPNFEAMNYTVGAAPMQHLISSYDPSQSASAAAPGALAPSFSPIPSGSAVGFSSQNSMLQEFEAHMGASLDDLPDDGSSEPF